MRRDGEGLAERYISIGKAIGEEHGMMRGEQLGEALGIISTARDLGASDAYIVDKLMSFLGITEKEARKYLSVHETPRSSKRTPRLRPLDGGRV